MATSARFPLSALRKSGPAELPLGVPRQNVQELYGYIYIYIYNAWRIMTGGNKTQTLCAKCLYKSFLGPQRSCLWLAETKLISAVSLYGSAYSGTSSKSHQGNGQILCGQVRGHARFLIPSLPLQVLHF